MSTEIKNRAKWLILISGPIIWLVVANQFFNAKWQDQVLPVVFIFGGVKFILEFFLKLEMSFGYTTGARQSKGKSSDTASRIFGLVLAVILIGIGSALTLGIF